MGILSRTKGAKEAAPRSVMAAAVPLAGPNAVLVSRALRAGTEDWQKEAWYHYDACGEFRSAVTWIANAVSKADVYAAETDPETGLVTGPTEDTRAQAAAAQVLGGVVKRGQLLKTLAVQWQVPGESFIIIRPMPPKRGVPQPDQWLAVSGTKVVYKAGNWQYQDPWTLMMVDLKAGTDRLIRIWSPHPNDGAKADSAARPALPILREIEMSSQNIASKLQSRLFQNGILPVPSEMDFPREPDQSLGDAFADILLQTAEAALSNPGTAAAQVPLIVPMPAELISAWQDGFIDLSTAFDAAVSDLRKDALARLAATLDMPNETAEGSTGGMNHWGAWQVEETTYKIFIEPLLDMLGDAVTQEWYWDVLRAMGEPRPERFVLAWETSGIVSRPDRQGELKALWDDILISDDYRRAEAGIPDEAVPTEEEHRRRLLEQLVKASPAILSEGVGAELGIEIQAPEPEPVQSAPALPAAAPEERPTEDVPEGLVAHAELLVFDALSRAGGRLLTREHRGQFGSTPKHELYRTIPHSRDEGELLEGSFQWVAQAAETYAVDPDRLHTVLARHTLAILRTRGEYDRRALRDNLRYL